MKPQSVASMEVQTLSDKYLSDKAVKALSKKATQTTVVEENGKTYVSTYFGRQVRTENIEEALKLVSSIANELAEKGLIHSCLSPIMKMDLCRVFGKAQTSVVLFYPLVAEDKVEEVNKLYSDSVVDIGSVPNPLGKVDLDLEEGEFLYNLKISQFGVALNSDPDKIAEREANRLLAILPRGTEIREISLLPINALCLDYEIKFFNKALKKVRLIEASYARGAEVVDEKLEQFNVFKGLKYYDKDDKELFM